MVIISPENVGTIRLCITPFLSVWVLLMHINALPPHAICAPHTKSSWPPVPLICLVPELSEGAGPIYLLGDGAKLVSDTLAGSGLPLILLPEQLRQQRASGVALCAMDRMLAGDPGDAAALTPNYLRMAQAERTRQNNQDFYLKK